MPLPVSAEGGVSTQQALRICAYMTENPSNHYKTNRYTHRPVKNRDAGPIAGVAFTGGGGSRQLGPDDNDPVSATQIPEHPTTPFLFHHTIHQQHFLFFISQPQCFSLQTLPLSNSHILLRFPLFRHH